MLDKPIDPKVLRKLEGVIRRNSPTGNGMISGQSAEDATVVISSGDPEEEVVSLGEDKVVMPAIPSQAEMQEILRKAMAFGHQGIRGGLALSPRNKGRSGYTKNKSLGTPKKTRKLAAKMRRLSRERA